MKTIFNPILKRRMFRLGGMALSVLLALSMMAAALPQPALAAGATTASCTSNYTVKNGDTKSMIADKFGLKWQEIAKDNNLAVNPKPVVGTKLCIPTKHWAASAYNGTMTASAVAKKLSETMSGFDTHSIWNVLVKDGTGGSNGYFKVGRITAPANGSVTGVYTLPQSLWKTPSLVVCVKNAASSKTICTKINHVV